MTSSPFDQMTTSLATAFARLVGLLLTFWTGADPTSPGVATQTVATARIAGQVGRYTVPLTVTAATIGVVVAGTRMAVASSRAQEPARDLVRGLLILTAVWWGGALLVRTLSTAFDEAGRHVLASAGVDAGSVDHLQTVLASLAVTDSGLVFLLGLVGALSGLAQVLLLLLRDPALALLAGALPVAAGVSVTGAGTVYVKRLLAWTAAFTAYPFVAAVVYAAAFVVMGTADDVGGLVAGVALVVVAVAALPAMIRLAAPAVQAVLASGAGDAPSSGEQASGALLLSGRGRQGAAGGPPSDAGPRTRPGLLAPTGSGLPALGGGRRPALSAPREPVGDDLSARRPAPRTSPRPATSPRPTTSPRRATSPPADRPTRPDRPDAER